MTLLGTWLVIRFCAGWQMPCPTPQEIALPWGGEEFLVVCRGMEGKLAQELAESLRNAVHSIEIAAGKHVTISIGVAQVTSNETLANLLARADAALCRAKSSGRDFVAIG